MPISKRRFESIDENGASPDTLAEQIVSFLLEHRDQAFRPQELERRTGIKHGSLGPTLTRLKTRGIVDHKAKYWTLSDSYLASEEAAVHTSRAAAEYDDGKEFDLSAWAEHADDENARQYTEE